MRKFFNCFPRTAAVFGDRYNKIDQRRYQNAFDDIAVTLPKTKAVVGQRDYDSVLIDLGEQLSWAPDAPNYFQKILIDEVNDGSLLEVLDKESELEIEKFWTFLITHGAGISVANVQCPEDHRSCRILKSRINSIRTQGSEFDE